MNIVKGKMVAEKILNEIDSLKKQISCKNPTVAIVRVGQHGDDITYEKSIVKKFSELQISTKLCTFDIEIDQDSFIKAIISLNNDKNIHGIIVLRPLPSHIDSDLVAQLIDYKKDIDGISHTNIARVFSQDNFGFVPCTPQAVMEVIDFLNIDLKGKNVTIVGAGMAVGRPLAILMLNQRATITVCRTLTKDLKKECLNADIIIAAAGVKHLITDEYVKEGTTIIDVGINVEDNKIYGDVDFESVVAKAGYITPVPGGVGSITTTILAKQLYKAIILQEDNK